MAGGQGVDGLGDVVEGDVALHRRHPGAAFHEPLVVVAEGAFHPLSGDPARRDRVDPHLGGQDPGQGAVEADDGGLAGRVGEGLRSGAQADDAGDVDDRAARGAQVGRGSAGHLEQAAYVDREDPVPFGEVDAVEVLGRRVHGRARVVDEQIELAEMVQRGLDEGTGGVVARSPRR
ncbi:hypothetical protein DF19_08385 [Streptomyces olindensis]|nr:hypothetical protein DF19_08385 [Streptomyces olindensis]